MENIFEINKKRIFQIGDIHSILPLIYRLTEEASREVRQMANRLEALPNKKSELALMIEAQINLCVERWQTKIEKLGAVPKGIWLADFDNGNGYYCWKFPETKIQYWHGYQDGFSGRMLIENQGEIDQ